MSEEIEVAALGLQLAVIAGFVVLMVLMHSAGLVGISRVLRLQDENTIPNEFGVRALLLMGSYGLLQRMNAPDCQVERREDTFGECEP